MVAHPVPIYLGCAGLIIGTLGLGAHHMLGGDRVGNTAPEQPLFAKSVEQAALPAPRWSFQNNQNQNPGVAFHEPMVELLTTGASPEAAQAAAAAAREEPAATQPEAVREIPVPQAPAREVTATASAPVPAPRVQGEAGVAAPREAVREVPQQQAEQPPKRTKNTRRAKTGSETSNPRSASERRRRVPEERRQREPEQRVIVREVVREPPGPRVREVVREPEPRIVRAPEPGFSPFRLFGIFDQH
jgi:hypothetical protein